MVVVLLLLLVCAHTAGAGGGGAVGGSNDGKCVFALLISIPILIPTLTEAAVND